jgi:hypothetical protein
MPRLNSQTRTAAMINLLVRARVPIPGKRGSSTATAKEDGRLLDCRLRLRFGARWRVVSLAGKSHSSELCGRMMIGSLEVAGATLRRALLFADWMRRPKTNSKRLVTIM